MTDKERAARVARAESHEDEFTDLAGSTVAHAINNLIKWGGQEAATLVLCMAEELGKIARAELDSRSVDAEVVMRGCQRTEDECRDLGALCLQLELACKNTREGIRKELER